MIKIQLNKCASRKAYTAQVENTIAKEVNEGVADNFADNIRDKILDTKADEFNTATEDYVEALTAKLKELDFDTDFISNFTTDYIQGMGGKFTAYPRTIWYNESGELFIKPLPNINTLTDVETVKALATDNTTESLLPLESALINKTIQSTKKALEAKIPIVKYQSDYVNAGGAAEAAERATNLVRYNDAFEKMLSRMLFNFNLAGSSTLQLFNESLLTKFLSGKELLDYINLHNLNAAMSLKKEDAKDFMEYVDNNAAQLIDKYYSSILTIEGQDIKIKSTLLDESLNEDDVDDSNSSALFEDHSKPVKLSQILKLFYYAIGNTHPNKVHNYLIHIVGNLYTVDADTIWESFKNNGILGKYFRSIEKAINELDNTTAADTDYFKSSDNRARDLKNAVISSIRSAIPLQISEEVDGSIELGAESNTAYTREEKDFLNALYVIEQKENNNRAVKIRKKIEDLKKQVKSNLPYTTYLDDIGDLFNNVGLFFKRDTVKDINQVNELLDIFAGVYLEGAHRYKLSTYFPLLERHIIVEDYISSANGEVTVHTNDGKNISTTTTPNQASKIRQVINKIKNNLTLKPVLNTYYKYNTFIKDDMFRNMRNILIQFRGSFDRKTQYFTDYVGMTPYEQYQNEIRLAYKLSGKYKTDNPVFIFKPFTQSDNSSTFFLKTKDVTVEELFKRFKEEQNLAILDIVVNDELTLYKKNINPKIVTRGIAEANRWNYLTIQNTIHYILGKYENEVQLTDVELEYLANFGYSLDENGKYKPDTTKLHKQVALNTIESYVDSGKMFGYNANVNTVFLNKLAYYQNSTKALTTGLFVDADKKDGGKNVTETIKRSGLGTGIQGAYPPNKNIEVLVYNADSLQLEVLDPYTGKTIRQALDDGASYSLMDYQLARYEWYGGTLQSQVTDLAGDAKTLYKAFDADKVSPIMIKHSEEYLTAGNINDSTAKRTLYEKLLGKPVVIDLRNHNHIINSNRNIVNPIQKLAGNDKGNAIIQLLQTTTFNNALELTREIERILNPENVVNDVVSNYTDQAQKIRLLIGQSLIKDYIFNNVYPMVTNNQNVKQGAKSVNMANSIDELGEANVLTVPLESAYTLSNPSHVIGDGKITVPSQISSAIGSEGNIENAMIFNAAMVELLKHDKKEVLEFLNVETTDFSDELFTKAIKEIAQEIADSRDNPIQEALILKAKTGKDIINDINLKDLISNKINTLISKVIKPKMKGELLVLRNGHDRRVHKVVLTDNSTVIVSEKEFKMLQAKGRVRTQTETTLGEAGNFKILNLDGTESPIAAKFFSDIEKLTLEFSNEEERKEKIAERVVKFKEELESKKDEIKVEPFKVMLGNAYKKDLPFIEELGLNATLEEIMVWSENAKIKVDAESLYEKLQKIKTIIGYRVPTTGKHSASLMEVVGFTDDNTNSIFVPPMLLYITGADLDIDKMITMFYDVKNHKGNKAESKNTRRDLTNNVMDAFVNMMKDPSVFIEGITPVSTQFTQELADKVGDNNTSVRVSAYKHATNEIVAQGLQGSGKGQVGITATNAKVYNNFIYSSFKQIAKMYEKAKAANHTQLNINSLPEFMDTFAANMKYDADGNLKEDDITVLYDKELLTKFLSLQPSMRLTTPDGVNYNIVSWGNIFNRKDVVQTWLYLSDLTNSATDNGKNPILSLIGSNMKTSPIFAGLVMMGYADTDGTFKNLPFSILEMLSDPTVKAALAEKNPVQAYKDRATKKELKGKLVITTDAPKLTKKQIKDGEVTEAKTYTEKEFRDLASYTLTADIKAKLALLPKPISDIFYSYNAKLRKAIKNSISTAINNAYLGDATKTGKTKSKRVTSTKLNNVVKEFNTFLEDITEKVNNDVDLSALKNSIIEVAKDALKKTEGLTIKRSENTPEAVAKRINETAETLGRLVELKDALRVTGKLLSINQGIGYTDAEVIDAINSFDKYINSLNPDEENKKLFSLEDYITKEGAVMPTWIANGNPALMLMENDTFLQFYEMLFESFILKRKMFLNLKTISTYFKNSDTYVIGESTTYSTIIEEIEKDLQDNPLAKRVEIQTTTDATPANANPDATAKSIAENTAKELAKNTDVNKAMGNVKAVIDKVKTTYAVNNKFDPKSNVSNKILDALNIIKNMYNKIAKFRDVYFKFKHTLNPVSKKEKVKPAAIGDATDRYIINTWLRAYYKNPFTIGDTTYDMKNDDDRAKFVDINGIDSFYSLLSSYIKDADNGLTELSKRLKIDTSQTANLDGTIKKGKTAFLEIKNVMKLDGATQLALQAQVGKMDTFEKAAGDYTLGDMYYLYMMLVNRSKFGKNKLTSTTHTLKASLEFNKVDKLTYDETALNIYIQKMLDEEYSVGVLKDYKIDELVATHNNSKQVKEKKIPTRKSTKKAARYYYQMIQLLNSKFGIVTIEGDSNTLIAEGLPAKYASNVATVYKGKIYFNSNNISPDAPAHEFVHIYLAALKNVDLGAYKQLLDLVTAEDLAEVQKRYKLSDGYTLEDQLEEALVERLGKDLLDINTSTLKSLYHNAVMFMKNAFKGIETALKYLGYKPVDSNIKTVTYRDLLNTLNNQLTEFKDLDEISSLIKELDIVKEKKGTKYAQGDTMNDTIFNLTGVDIKIEDKTYVERANELLISPSIHVNIKEKIKELLKDNDSTELGNYLRDTQLQHINPMNEVKEYLADPDSEHFTHKPALKAKLDFLFKSNNKYGDTSFDTNTHNDVVIQTTKTVENGVEYTEVSLMGLLNTSALKNQNSFVGKRLISAGNLINEWIFGFDLNEKNKKNAMFLKLWMISQEMRRNNPNIIISDFSVSELSYTGASEVTDSVHKRDGYYINKQFKKVFYSGNGKVKPKYDSLVDNVNVDANYKVDYRLRYLSFLSNTGNVTMYDTIKAIKDSSAIPVMRNRISSLESQYSKADTDEKKEINTEISILRGLIAELQGLQVTYNKDLDGIIDYVNNTSNVANKYVQFLSNAIGKANNYIGVSYHRFKEEFRVKTEDLIDGLREVNPMLYYSPSTGVLGFRNYYREIMEIDTNGKLTGRFINEETSPRVNPGLWKSKWDGYLKNDKIKNYINYFVDTKELYFEQALSRKGQNSDISRFYIEQGDKYKIPLVSAKASQSLLAKGEESLLSGLTLNFGSLAKVIKRIANRVAIGVTKTVMPLNANEEIDGNRLDEGLESNIDNYFFSQLASRNIFNTKVEQQDFEYNLESVLSLFVMSEIKTPVFNDIQQDFRDVEALLKLQSTELGVNTDVTTKFIKAFFESAILDSNKRVKKWHETVVSNSGQIASYLALGADIGSAVSNFLTNLWTTSSMVLQDLGQRGFTSGSDLPSFRALMRASAIMGQYTGGAVTKYVSKATGHIKDLKNKNYKWLAGDTYDKVTFLLERSRLLDLDYSKMVGNNTMATGSMRGDFVYILHGAGDAYHKATFMISKMIQDGVWDAMELKTKADGTKELVYNQLKDKRIYDQKKSTENNPVFATNGKAFKEFLEKDTGNNVDFPYSDTMLQVIKKQSNKLYGSFSKEDQAVINNWALGRWMLVFRRWISDKVAQYFRGTDTDNAVEPRMVFEDGEYKWQLGYTQGVWYSVLAYMNTFNSSQGYMGDWRSLHKSQQNNVIKFAADLTVLLSLLFSMGLFFDEDEWKRKKGLAGYLKNTISDLYMVMWLPSLWDSTLNKSSLATGFINQLMSSLNFLLSATLDTMGVNVLDKGDYKQKYKQGWKNLLGLFPLGSDYIRVGEWQSGWEDLFDGDGIFLWNNKNKVKNRIGKHNNPTEYLGLGDED